MITVAACTAIPINIPLTLHSYCFKLHACTLLYLLRSPDTLLFGRKKSRILCPSVSVGASAIYASLHWREFRLCFFSSILTVVVSHADLNNYPPKVMYQRHGDTASDIVGSVQI